MCLGAIYWARLESVYFGSTRHDAARAGFDDSFIYDELSTPHEHRKIPMVQMLKERADKTFLAWQQHAARIEY
jgi:tRNA(Arg) A34 adenosine deaminase TadA